MYDVLEYMALDIDYAKTLLLGTVLWLENMWQTIRCILLRSNVNLSVTLKRIVLFSDMLNKMEIVPGVTRITDRNADQEGDQR